MSFEVIIVGGSFAGQAAALQLARARRRVLLIDGKQPRNRFAAAAHGFLTRDGTAPAAIIAEAARQLAAYPTITQREGEVVTVGGTAGDFHVALADGSRENGARLILAGGVRDQLPGVTGLSERWGVSVLHCPYCHGYEHADRPLGVLAAGPQSLHQALLIPDWGPTTLFTQALFEPDADQTAQLAARGVRLERSPVEALLGTAPRLEAVRLADGRTLELAALFVAPRTELANDLAGQLGCQIEESPAGPRIQVDTMQRTSVPGVFAAGDASMAMANATLATASGVMAAGGSHHSLIHGPAEPPVQTPR